MLAGRADNLLGGVVKINVAETTFAVQPLICSSLTGGDEGVQEKGSLGRTYASGQLRAK